MNVPPVSVRYLPADRYNPAHWQVQHCPFCGKRHLHGADSPRYGIPAKDSLGSRFAHCISGELYELVPDLNHRPTRAALDNTQ